MRLLLLSLSLLFFGCSQPGNLVPGSHHARLADRPSPEAAVLPEPLRVFLHRDLPDWQLVNEGDYDRSFWSLYAGDHLPYLVTTDVNDDGLADHCVLLKIAGYVEPFFLLGRDDGSFHILRQDAYRVPFDDAVNDLRYALTIEAPGQIDVVKPAINSLLLRSNGINFLELENRWCIFYWDNSSISAFTCR